MHGNLMTFIVHTLDDFRPFRCCVNLTFAVVVGSNEERCLGLGLLEDIKELMGVVGRTIVEGQSYGIGLLASADSVLVDSFDGTFALVIPSGWAFGD